MAFVPFSSAVNFRVVKDQMDRKTISPTDTDRPIGVLRPYRA